jgi:hypothetical protein
MRELVYIRAYTLVGGSIRSTNTKEKYLERMGYFLDRLDIHQKDPEKCFEILTPRTKVNFT